MNGVETYHCYHPQFGPRFAGLNTTVGQRIFLSSSFISVEIKRYSISSPMRTSENK